jgi:hypothetical protein
LSEYRRGLGETAAVVVAAGRGGAVGEPRDSDGCPEQATAPGEAVGRRYFRPCRCGGGLCGVDLPEVGALDCRYEGENLDQALSLSGEVSPQLLRTFSFFGGQHDCHWSERWFRSRSVDRFPRGTPGYCQWVRNYDRLFEGGKCSMLAFVIEISRRICYPDSRRAKRHSRASSREKYELGSTPGASRMGSTLWVALRWLCSRKRRSQSRTSQMLWL